MGAALQRIIIMHFDRRIVTIFTIQNQNKIDCNLYHPI